MDITRLLSYDSFVVINFVSLHIWDRYATSFYTLKQIQQVMDIFSDWVFQFGSSAPIDLTFLAQNVTDPNILGQMQKSFTHFVQTGQAWALLIGLAIGYMIRNLTSYG